MRLRRVTISGFKTFARRCDIVLDRGVTAIVGPNGSGKSNLVDAIRWGLGETNARELRGARMDEVIYAGGQGRGRMGMAEVALVLDNEDGRLGSEDAEVAVSRRVTRNGDSEYRLNGDRARLRDLERVLGATGLTQTGYSVVAQNDIDAIIHATPGQRRALVEQAAGVRSLRAAADDATERMRTVDQTILRLDDLLRESEPRLAELTVQAELALEQRRLTERLTELRGSLAREEWRAARGQLRQAQRIVDAASARVEAAAVADRAFRDRLDAELSLRQEARTASDAAVAAAEAARVEAERAAGEVRRWLDRINLGAIQRTAADLEMRAAAVELQTARQGLGDVAEHDDVQSAWTDAESAVAAARRTATEAKARAQSAQVRAEQTARDLAAAERDERAVISRVSESAARAEVADKTVASLSHELALAHEQRGRREAEARTAQAAAQTAAGAVSAADARLEEARRQLQQQRIALRDAQAELSLARDQSQAALAEAATVRGQLAGMLGHTGPVAAAVAGGSLRGRRLVDCFRIGDPADGPAIEAALEGHVSAWIVDDLSAAVDLLERSGSREYVVSDRVVGVPRASPPPGVRAAIDAVNADAGAEGAMSHLLHGVWLARDRASAENAVATAGGQAVLPDGLVISVAGARAAGQPGQMLELADAERRAIAAAEQTVAAETAAQAAVQDCSRATAIAEEAAAAAAAESEPLRVASADAAGRARAADAALEAEQHRIDNLENMRAARETERTVAAEAHRAEAGRLAEITRRVADLRERAVADQATSAAARSASDSAEVDLREAEVIVTQLQMRADDLERRRSHARRRVREAEVRWSAAEFRLTGLESDLLIAVVRASAARRTTALAEASVAAAAEQVAAAAPRAADAEARVAAVETERSDVAIALARATDERDAATATVQRLSAQVAELASAARDDDEAEGPEPDSGAAERAEREIVRLERRISGLGPVNGLAPEQREELAARVDVWRGARSDLAGAASDVRALAAQLVQQIETRFETIFAQVGDHFGRLYSELFPGGHAGLRLENVVSSDGDDGDEEPSADELRALRLPGVEILAQPAGKRLQPLSLLSGGERALTALAMILALQQVNPSPFYVFDEVDAPLDDSNVVRFTRLLRRLADEQQFIVVTHNHLTMASADALYGVTVGSDGVSTVLSVRLAAAQELAAEVPGRRRTIASTAV